MDVVHCGHLTWPPTNTDPTNCSAMIGGNKPLPKKGTVYITAESKSQKDLVSFAEEIQKLGFGIYATKGTAAVLRKNKILENSYPLN